MSNSIYDVLDGNGNVVNVIVLEDPSAWTPPTGCSVRVHVQPEPIVSDPVPIPLDEAALIDLCQSAGGMTDAMLVSVYTDPQLAAFVIKIKAARQILPTDARTVQGLGALEALGYLPEGAEAVISAWPTA